MTTALERRCVDLLCKLGLASEGDPVEVVPLGGGVASDIARVGVGGRDYCVKFALEKLKVAEEWRVPVHRNRAEYAWLEFAASVEPSSVPRLYGQSGTGFVMELVASPEVVLWKDELLHGTPDIRRAVSVAQVLARIHAASANSVRCRNSFRNHDDFLAIRIEPYLHFTASRHPDLARQLHELGEGLHRRQVGDAAAQSGAPVLLRLKHGYRRGAFHQAARHPRTTGGGVSAHIVRRPDVAARRAAAAQHRSPDDGGVWVNAFGAGRLSTCCATPKARSFPPFPKSGWPLSEAGVQQAGELAPNA